MKTYLNRAEKEDYITLAAAQVAAEKIITRWGERDNLTAEERGRLKSAATHIGKSLALIAKRLAPDQGASLVRTAASTKVICVPDEKQSTFNKRIAEEESTEQVIVRKETLDALAEMAIDRCCCPCIHADEKETCPCRLAFLELDIPVYDENPNEGRCPWEVM